MHAGSKNKYVVEACSRRSLQILTIDKGDHGDTRKKKDLGANVKVVEIFTSKRNSGEKPSLEYGIGLDWMSFLCGRI